MLPFKQLLPSGGNMNNSKGLLKSGTILANLSLLLPAADLLLQAIEQVPAAILPPAISGIWIGVGSMIAIIRRITTKKTIEGIF